MGGCVFPLKEVSLYLQEYNNSSLGIYSCCLKKATGFDCSLIFMDGVISNIRLLCLRYMLSLLQGFTLKYCVTHAISALEHYSYKLLIAPIQHKLPTKRNIFPHANVSNKG